MISIHGSTIRRSIWDGRRLSCSARTILTQKFSTEEICQENKTIVVPMKVPFLPDRSGMIPLATIPQLTEISSNVIRRSETILKPHLHLKDSRLIAVVKTQFVKVLPELYQHMKTNNQLLVHVSLRDVGTKSFNNQFDIYDETNSTMLCRNIRTLVVCDVKTKPVPIPDAILASMKSFTTHKDRFVCPLPFSCKPDSVFTTSVTPRPSDLDTLYHVNQSNYLTYMLDAAVCAAKAGVYKCLKQDVAFSFIDEIILNYSRELLLDDDIKIETWQDKENPLKICFEMSKQSCLAFQGSVLLQEPLLQLSRKIKQKLPRAQEF